MQDKEVRGRWTIVDVDEDVIEYVRWYCKKYRVMTGRGLVELLTSTSEWEEFEQWKKES